MKVVRMMRVLRRGLLSLAIAVVFVAMAMLVGQGVGAGGLRTELMAEAVRVPDLNAVKVQPTTVSRVVCDEGTNACEVPVVLGAVGAAEATTYDRRAVADKDYKPLKAVPVKVDGEGSTRILVDLIDDTECEPTEDFLVVVTGPDVQATAVVSIVDKDG
jgi:hypothetical protein